MRPKGKLFALLAVFMAIAVVAATGAFTTVSAERTATIEAAGDSSALLAFSPGDDNGDYIVDSGSEFQIDLTNASNGADGVNLNSTTTVDNMLTITNNGGDPVDISINTTGANAGAVSFYNGTTSAGTDITNGTNSIVLGSGNSTQVSMEIDTTDYSSLSNEDEILDTVEIYAERNVSG